MEEADQRKLEGQSISVFHTLVNPRVWHLACIGFGHGFATYALSFWLPQIVKSAAGGRSNSMIGLLVMIPNLLGLAAMVIVARHSDQTRERRYHLATCLAFAGTALLLSGVSQSLFFLVALFSVVAMGAYGWLPVFFSLPGEFLAGFSAAAGIALVTSVANFGGFVGPYTVGMIRQRTGRLHAGLICAGVFYLFSATLALALPKHGLSHSGHQESRPSGVAFGTGT